MRKKAVLPLLSGLVAGMLVLTTGAIAQPLAPTPDLAAIVARVEAGQLERAESEVHALLGARDDAVARDLLGVILSRQGRFEEAEEQFQRAIEMGPDLQAPRQHLARAYLQQQRPDRALSALRAAARLGPLDRDLAEQLASAEITSGNLGAAEQQLRSLVERFDSVRALLDLARLEARRGEREAADRTLRRALEIAPNSEEALSAFARLSLAAREPVPAIRALEPLTRMHPSVAEHAYLLGVARLQIGENDGAVETLMRARDLEPDRPQTLTALGLALNHQKRFGEARKSLARSLELEPGSTETLAALADAEEGLGELQDAERHALQALAGGAHAGAHLVIGKVRMNQERYDEAREALEKAIAADPTSAKAHYQLSLAYARLGDRDGSREHLELYRDALGKAEEHLIELRTKAGLGASGMKR